MIAAGDGGGCNVNPVTSLLMSRVLYYVICSEEGWCLAHILTVDLC